MPAPPAGPRHGAVLHRTASKVLHQTVHDEAFGCAVLAFRLRSERIGVETSPAPRRCLRAAASPGTATSSSEVPGIGSWARKARRSSRRRLSGDRFSTDVAQAAARPASCSELMAVPRSNQPMHVFAFLAPQLEIASEADTLPADIGAGLLKPEREPPGPRAILCACFSS